MKFGGANLAFTLDDLGDAEPVKSWSDANGISHDLYTIVQKDGDWILFIASQTAEDEEPDVIQVARIPTTVLPADAKPAIDIDADGMLSITLDDGKGQAQVLKLMLKKQKEGAPRECSLRTPSGDEFKIKVDQIDEDDGE